MHTASAAPAVSRGTLARQVAALTLLVICAGLAAVTSNALAWSDLDGNKIDDAIDRVHAEGWAAAFVNHDPAQRMVIGVENPTQIVYAVYVGYEHAPTSTDQALLQGTGVSMVWPLRYIPYIESRATFAQIQLIATLPGVTRVEAVPVEYSTNHYGTRVVRVRDSRGLTAADNDVLFPSVRSEFGYDGTGIVIAILDTGVNDDVDAGTGYPGHESLLGKFLGGGEFWCGQPVCSTPPDGSANPQDHGAEASSYHATHVAGTAMGTGGPGGYFAGVAPAARLVDCKVLSDAGASVGGSTRGLEWVIANRNRLWPGLEPGSIWQGIDVVNMSLGSTECATGSASTGGGASSLMVNAAVDAGIVVVIATGNDDAINCISSPAAADKALAVGASLHARTLDRADDRVTLFSNEGPRDDDGDADHLDEMKPAVVAPGAGIISASGDPASDGTAYQQLSGTSMAAPHVAGCVALMLQANPALTPADIATILRNTAFHDVPSAKATGDRGQDPYGVDVNYDPGSGWGLVDMYAAMKEVLDSVTGVQVVQLRAIPRTAEARIDVTWQTQREHPYMGFHLHRAPDAGGAPGAFSPISASMIPPSPLGDPILAGDDNRTAYLFQDTDASLELGRTYWYRVEWVDMAGTPHLEPPVRADYGDLARVATVFYSIVHNAADNDLAVRIGADQDYDPGALGNADYEILGPGESQQDSAVVLLPTPANTGTSTTGTIEHFWSVGFNAGDGADPYLPPSTTTPWFLSVVDGGFVNRTGRVTGFSMFVNDTPGSASGTTYVTTHQPMPQPLVEGGATPVTLWIPEQGTVSVAGTLRADAEAGACRLEIELYRDGAGWTASVFRSTSNEFESRQRITETAIPVSGSRFAYRDASVLPGRTYHYWVQLHAPDGSSTWMGPVAVATPGSLTYAAPAQPNPARRTTRIAYEIGADVAAHGPVAVSLTLHDVLGRRVRTLHEAHEGVGRREVEWDTLDSGGRPVEPGLYYVRFRAGSVVGDRKLTVVR